MSHIGLENQRKLKLLTLLKVVIATELSIKTGYIFWETRYLWPKLSHSNLAVTRINR